jgi:hypothetical protein
VAPPRASAIDVDVTTTVVEPRTARAASDGPRRYASWLDWMNPALAKEHRRELDARLLTGRRRIVTRDGVHDVDPASLWRPRKRDDDDSGRALCATRGDDEDT